MKTCLGCDFFVAKKGYTWGICHRYPRPVPKREWAKERNDGAIVANLPKVYDTDYCGEYKEDFNEPNK